MRRFLAGALLAAFIAAAAAAQQPQVGAVGEVTFANSGAPAAQASFLYGLAQLHNFEYDAAARAFADAQRADAGFAMAVWGEAMTKNHPVWMEQDLGGARRVLDRLGPSPAARIAKGGSERERAYLSAVETLYGAGDKPARDVAYLEAMRRLHDAYPDDVDATAFYGLALLGSAHDGRDTAIYMQAAAALEDAFASRPNHPGLAHYLIHAYDDAAHAPLGLRAARRYASIAPAAPHALHMTSHIFLAVGMWDDVVAANERAGRVAADRARLAGRAPAGCGHVNMWLLYGYLQQGRRAEARAVLDACRAEATGANGRVVRAAEQDPLDPDNIPAGSYIQMWSRFLIDTGEWTSELAREDVPLGDLTGAALTRAYVRGLGAAARGDAAGLAVALSEFQAQRRKLEAGRTRDRYSGRAAVIEQELQGLMLLREQRPDDAVAALRKAAIDEHALPVEFGPPFVDKPADELLGDVLQSLSRLPEAADAYRTALQRTPKRAGAAQGLARASRD